MKTVIAVDDDAVSAITVTTGDMVTKFSTNLHAAKVIGLLHEEILRLRESLVCDAMRPVTEMSSQDCPLCGGEADNGFSRDVPPVPYVCTKCQQNAIKAAQAGKDEIKQWTQNKK